MRLSEIVFHVVCVRGWRRIVYRVPSAVTSVQTNSRNAFTPSCRIAGPSGRQTAVTAA